MKQRRLTPVQANWLIRTIRGFSDVVYQPTQALVFGAVGNRNFRLVYDNNLKFTGVAHRIY